LQEAHIECTAPTEAAMKAQLSGLEWWRTEHLLVVYEQLFGPLEPKSKQRILAVARTRGWDRAWEERAA